MEGGGVKVIWTKSKRTASFFGSPSLTLTMLFTSLQGMRLQFEGSQLKCGEGCELAESLDKISCHVDGWSPALDMVSFAASHVCVYTLAFSEPLPNDRQALIEYFQVNSFNMSLSCDALLGHELMVSHATCRGCDQGTGVGVLPQTCGLFYSGVGSGGKGNWSDRERLITLLMLFTLGVLFFLLMRELRRGPKVTCENQSMRGSVNREKIKMQTRKPKLNETIRKPKQKSEAEIRSAKEDESAPSEPRLRGCCQDKAREMAISKVEARRAPTFLLEHSMLKERRRKVAS